MSHPSHQMQRILRLVGRVSLEIEPLTQKTFSTRPSGESVEIRETYPSRPFLPLARIAATSRSESKETLRERILDEARCLGADAVVLGQAHALETTPQDRHNRSIIGPFNRSSNSSERSAWGLTQEAADQSEWTLQLSAVAIRYEPKDTAPVSQINHTSR